jgi:hypothetical protein
MLEAMEVGMPEDRRAPRRPGSALAFRRRRRSSGLVVAPLAAIFAVACSGALDLGTAGPRGTGPARTPIDPTTPTTPTPLACSSGVPQASPAPLRRLTPDQYRNTVRDLLGDPGYVPAVDDAATIVTERGVRQYRDAAELAITRRASWERTIFPCDTSGAADDSCAASLIDDFGARAFRRPITAEDREPLLAAYRAALSAGLTFDEAMETSVEVMLQSPELLYVEEHGIPGPTVAIRRLTSFELATRLSYFLWDTTPDEMLLAAAGTGTLEGDALRAQVDRMIADPRAGGVLQDFFWRWLELDGGRLHNALEASSKDPTLYPEYGPELQAAMRTELEALVRDVFASGGSFADLMTTRRAYVNGPLAAIYGVAGPTSADDWQWVELPEGERAGLLTRAAFLTVFSTATVQSPIRRGVFVMEEVFCSDLGTPPPNASDTPVDGGDDGDGVRTVREDVIARTSDGTCTGCHSLINPLGFAFEHYDGIGRFRTEEVTSGLPIDAVTEVRGTDVDGPVSGAAELSARIASSATAEACFASRFFERAVGRAPGPLDACSVEEITTRFAASGSIRELLVAIVESDAFQYVSAGEVSP